MLVVGKVPLFNQERRINNKNNAVSLHRNEMQDSVSFKKREDMFIITLDKLCKEGTGDRDLMALAQGLARDVVPNHPNVLAAFENIKSNSSIPEGVRAWILEDLSKLIGKGGNKITVLKLGRDFTK